MALIGDRSASFIVRVWREPREPRRLAAEWRGSIEHVGSRRKVFFRRLEDIAEFVRPFLKRLEERPPTKK
jgi:hypothetical protein